MPFSKITFSFKTALLLLFYSLFFFTPLYFRFSTEELFEFNKMILVYGFTLVITTTWMLRMIFEKRVILSRSKLDTPILLFVLVQFLASIISIHPRTSFLGYYSRFHGGFLSTLSYAFLYYSFISNIEKKHLRQLLVAFFSSLSLVSLWGIFEHFGHSLSCVALTGSFSVNCWVQDVQNRVYASFGQPNWMAAFIIGLIPVLISETIAKKRHSIEKVLYFTTLILGLAALYYTKSRSGFLGLAGGLTVFYGALVVVWLSAKKSATKFLGHIPAIATGIALLLGVSLLTGTPYSPSLSELISSSTQTNDEPAATVTETDQVVNRLEIGGTDSGEIRKIVWEGAIDVWKRYPLLGSGVETFAYSYYKDRPAAHNQVSEWDFLYNKAHNELLNFLATTGIAGLLTYLSMWVAAGALAFSAVFLRKETDFEDKVTLIGVSAGLVALMISNFFGFSTVTIALLMFVYFALIALITNSVTATTTIAQTSNKKNKKQKTQELLAWQYMVGTLTLLCSIFLLTKLYTYWSADVNYATGKTYIRSGNYEKAIQSFQTAISKSPKEALFYDTFSVELGRIAVSLAEQQEATAAAQIAQTAIALSDTALSLNDVHLNFYKTRTRLFITLSQLEPQLLYNAKETLTAAIERAPNDPKLFYNLGVVETSIGNTDQGIQLLETAVALKPNYAVARLQLGREYAEQNRLTDAREQLMFILDSIDPKNEAAWAELDSISAVEATASDRKNK